jgi:hypothetical protein
VFDWVNGAVTRFNDSFSFKSTYQLHSNMGHKCLKVTWFRPISFSTSPDEFRNNTSREDRAVFFQVLICSQLLTVFPSIAYCISISHVVGVASLDYLRFN